MLLFSLVILSAVLFLTSRWLWRFKIGSGLSPTGLYSLVWGVTWFVFWSDFMHYRPISDLGLVYSAIPLVAIFSGEITAFTTFRRVAKSEWVSRMKAFWPWSTVFGMITLFAGVVTFAASWMAFGNVITHAQALKLARVAMGPGMYSGTPLAFVAKYASILLGAFFPATVFGALRLRLTGQKAWKGLALTFVGVVLFDLGWGSRVNTFYFVLLFLMTMFVLPLPKVVRTQKFEAEKHTANKKKKGRILVIGTIVIVAYLAMNIIGIKTRHTSTLFVGNRELPFSLVQLIDYNIGTLSGFDQTLDENTERTWGRMSFFGFEQWLRLFRVIPRSVAVPSQLEDWQYEYVTYMADGSWTRPGNVYTWLRYLYSDFGVGGLVVIPFLIGWLATRAVARGLSRNSLGSLSLVCALYFTILISGSIIPFKNESFVFGIVLAYCATAGIMRFSGEVSSVPPKGEGTGNMDTGNKPGIIPGEVAKSR